MFSTLTGEPVSFSTDVIVTFAIPHGTMWLKGARSPQTFSANPCMVIQCRTPTPIEAIFRSSTHTPVKPCRVVAAIPISAKASINNSSSQRR
jgi:hypothetical protein